MTKRPRVICAGADECKMRGCGGNGICLHARPHVYNNDCKHETCFRCSVPAICRVIEKKAETGVTGED
jgi:hypothetical protein